jgi:hypothetical protein
MMRFKRKTKRVVVTSSMRPDFTPVILLLLKPLPAVDDVNTSVQLSVYLLQYHSNVSVRALL